jgi:hypothetical protein
VKVQKNKSSVGLWLLRAIGVAVLAVSLLFTLSLAASAETVDGEISESESAPLPEQESGFLDSAFAFLSDQLPLVLSGLTLIGTGILARLFRSSLLPILEGGIRRVGGGVEEIESKTREMLAASEKELAELSALVSRLVETSGGEEQRLLSLRGEMIGMMSELGGSLRLEAERLDAALEMLKEVFTAARLPAASKLALEEIYRKTPHSDGRVAKIAVESEGSM